MLFMDSLLTSSSYWTTNISSAHSNGLTPDIQNSYIAHASYRIYVDEQKVRNVGCAISHS